jgi:DNA-binding XRE family transcriptional regulator
VVQRRKIVGSSAPPTSFGLRCSNSFTNYFLKSPISSVPTTNPTLVTIACESADYRSDEDLCDLIWCAVVCLFRSRVALQAEILVLRQQLNVLRCKSPRRVHWATLTREQLAFEAQIDLTYLGGIERGKRNPSLLVMGRIAFTSAQAWGADRVFDELYRERAK